MESYDPYTDTWTPISPALKYVSNFSAAGCQGRLYLVGSSACKYNALALQCYNPVTGRGHGTQTPGHAGTLLAWLGGGGWGEWQGTEAGSHRPPCRPQPQLGEPEGGDPGDGGARGAGSRQPEASYKRSQPHQGVAVTAEEGGGPGGGQGTEGVGSPHGATAPCQPRGVGAGG